MNGLAVLIPVKARGLKSRLSPVLGTARRTEFAELMLLDVLDAFSGAGLISSCFIISSSRRTRLLAEGRGAVAVAEPLDSGVNSAVAAGMRAAGTDKVMVVPADIPLLTASEIRQAIALSDAWAEVIVTPSADFDGTNLLCFSRSKPVPLSFDHDSFWNHLQTSAARGYRVAVHSAKGFRFDVDTVPHFSELARARAKRRAVDYAREIDST